MRRRPRLRFLLVRKIPLCLGLENRRQFLALFLYGVALVYAGTGSLTIYGSGGIVDFFGTQPVALFDVGVLLAGLAMMIVGLAFKISAAPFHQWAPDVYQGAASGSVALMSAGVKIAGVAALARVLFSAFATRIDDWAPLLALLPEAPRSAIITLAPAFRNASAMPRPTMN